jgi:tetratricopeptide (TPR) repeat protein
MRRLIVIQFLLLILLSPNLLRAVEDVSSQKIKQYTQQYLYFMKNRRYGSAHLSIKKALLLAQGEFSNNNSLLGQLHYRTGRSLRFLGKLKESEKHFKKTIIYFKKLSLVDGFWYYALWGELGTLYYKRYQFFESEKALQKAISYISEKPLYWAKTFGSCK